MMRGLKAGASSTGIDVLLATAGGTVVPRGQAAVVRGRRERALPLRRGKVLRSSRVAARCPRRVRAVRALSTLVQRSVGWAQAGVLQALVYCVRRDARRRNLLDRPGLVPRPSLLAIALL